MVDAPIDPWDQLWDKLDVFKLSLAKSKAINVNAESTRSKAKEIVQHYFRVVRPALLALNADDVALGVLDEPLQDILQLSNGRNRRDSYNRAIRQLRAARSSVELQRERSVGAQIMSQAVTSLSAVEQRILTTLQRMIPSAALSYEQACNDLGASGRLSYRGTAVELREALREVLDHLAPDEIVMKSQGFKLERDMKKPTMKQKTRFILRSRGLTKVALSSPQDAIARVEEATASLARSVYTRGSLSTHVSTTYEEVMHLKMYADGVLAELLQVHAATMPPNGGIK